MDYNDLYFIIFDVSESNKINFDEVLETSVETLRLSIDGKKTFVKWYNQTIPNSVLSLTSKSSPYTYQLMLDILSTPEWTRTE